jgi:Sulfotransferase family
MPLPNFFIVGAAKSGTTALYRYLRQHPDVFLPDVKEPRHFAYDPDDHTEYAGPRAHVLIDSVVKDRARYEALYAGVNGERALGDASPAYLVSPIAAGRIHQAVPEARIVAVLRDPVERAYSNFVDNVQDGWEPERDFDRVLALQEQRRRENWWRKWDYVGHGFYADQLQRYYDTFDAQRMRVYLYEDLQADRRGLVRNLLGFLGVDPSVELDVSGRHNVSAVPRSERVQNLVGGRGVLKRTVKPLLPAAVRRRLRSGVERRNLHKPEMSAEARATLREIYREDVERLESLIGRDLSAWR